MVPRHPLRPRSFPPDPGGGMGGIVLFIIISGSYKAIIFRVFGKPIALVSQRA
jgi:hypothetical protein